MNIPELNTRVFRQRNEQQHGSALVVALVLVLVSTLLGLSAMQSSNMETQLANNIGFHQASFRVAEAAADSMLTLQNIITLVNTPATTIISNNSIDSSVDVTSNFQALGESPATGYSLGGQNGFRSLKFASQAMATIDSVDSSSRVVQGIERLASSQEN